MQAVHVSKFMSSSWTKKAFEIKNLDIYDKYLILMVPPARLERTAPRLGIWCSIHLSYGGMKNFLCVIGVIVKYFKRAGTKFRGG
ncbi:hypothetical protein PITCH_A760043 [uncultured Desulfobacterium sp.]|uniref:Uncharacterized protein n=1 Tax=uncultured Desulfobacterium sp. TaxID=201089 RepID=A0A445N2A3_9BACT|nr:hypothetical protein PITCH_A760043 [uncultured Desulfobacterium sp.]